MKTITLILINDYLEKVKYYVQQLQVLTNETNLLRSRRLGIIPVNGKLLDGTEYWFHGVSCSITNTSYIIDFDFGADGIIDGFDAWRLWEYAKSYPEKYSSITSIKVIELELSNMENKGLIHKLDKLPKPNLFVFSKNN